MGKKPFVVAIIGILMILSAFTVEPGDPKCGSGSMSPSEVCEDLVTGEVKTYDEMKAGQVGPKVPMIGLGVILIGYGVYVAVKRSRNPNWQAEAKAKADASREEARRKLAAAQQPKNQG